MSQFVSPLGEASLLRKFITGIGHTNANESYLRTLNESVIRRLFFAVFEKMPSHSTDTHLGTIREKGEREYESNIIILYKRINMYMHVTCVLYIYTPYRYM